MALLPTKKITALPPFTPPLTGNEEIEAVQLGNSVKVSTRAFVLPTDSLLTFSAMGGFLPGSRQLTAGIGMAFVDGGPGSTLELNATGAVAGGANPTALVGLTAVNGAALTYMRSDAAPALDQSISPVWTGNHSFRANQNEIRNAVAQLFFIESDAAADNQVWPIRISSEQFTIGALNDLGSVFSPWVTVDRTGTVIDTVNLQGTTVQVNGQSIRDAAILTSGTVATARLGSGTANDTTWLRGDQSWQGLPGGFTGFANPTASIGLAAVNGAATTAMRSDAAPALSQAIVPTWTGRHVFAATASASLNGFSANFNSTAPGLQFNESDAAVNNRVWTVLVSSEQMAFRIDDDTLTLASTPWLTVDRTGTAVDGINFFGTGLFLNGNPVSTAVGANPTASVGLAAVNGAAATFMRSDAAPALSQSIAPTWSAQHTFSLAGTGSAPTILLSSVEPWLVMNETDAAVDNRRWYQKLGGEALEFGIMNDASGVLAAWLAVNRTGTVVDSVAFPAAQPGAMRIGTTAGAFGFTTPVCHTYSTGAGGLGASLGATCDTSAVPPIVSHNRATAGDNQFVLFGTEASFTSRGSITYNRAGGLVAYNTSSDARRKTNIVDAPDATDQIRSIRVRSFDWIDSGIHVDHWLVAQEVNDVLPMAVTVGDDERDWAVDPSKLIPLLIKGLQSVFQRLDAVGA